MKKMLAMFILAMLTMQVAIAGDVVTKDVNKLPASARETIKKHFPQTKISYIKIDKDLFKSTTYEATLTNGVEIDFDSKGEWMQKRGGSCSFYSGKCKSICKREFPGTTDCKVRTWS